MKNSFLIKIIIIVFLFGGTILSFAIAADTAYVLLEPGVFKETTEVTNFNQYANLVFGVLLSVAIALAILMIVLGGFQYVTTASGLGKSAGKEKIISALTGLAILLLSWLALNTINPNLVNWTFKVDQLGTPKPEQEATPNPNPATPNSPASQPNDPYIIDDINQTY